MKISKNYSPNDRFLIKIFMKIISLDSSQRVPPMSPCPPLIITTVCPWLINPLSDPWDFNKSNGILLRTNWRKPYPKSYGSEFYGSGCVYLGVVKKTSQKVPTYLPTWWGGLLIRCWHYPIWYSSWSFMIIVHYHPWYSQLKFMILHYLCAWLELYRALMIWIVLAIQSAKHTVSLVQS